MALCPYLDIGGAIILVKGPKTLIKNKTHY